MYLSLNSANTPAPTAKMRSILLSAVECLRLADAKLEAMMENDADSPGEFGVFVTNDVLFEVQCSVQLYIGILQHEVGGQPHLPERVFRDLRRHANDDERNPAGVESVLMCLILATRCLDEFIRESAKQDNEVWSDLDKVANGGAASLGLLTSMIDSVAFSSHGFSDTLDAILDGSYARSRCTACTPS